MARAKELPYQPTFFDRIELWPKCMRCRKRYAPLKPLRTERTRLVKRNNCTKCGAAVVPLEEKHFVQAMENKMLIKSALRLHRKDLWNRWINSPTFRQEITDWGILQIALCARLHDPAETKFSTYVVSALRNVLNQQYPIMMPTVKGGDDSDDVYKGIVTEIDNKSTDADDEVFTRILTCAKRIRHAEFNLDTSSQWASYGRRGQW